MSGAGMLAGGAIAGMPLSALLDPGGVDESLRRAGMAPEGVEAARALLTSAAAVLRNEQIAETRDAAAFFVPGRIEVLGKHTDYGGGRSLLAATERGFLLIAVPRADRLIRVYNAVSLSRAEFPLDPELSPRGGWANYPMTVARRIARNFPEARTGAEIAFASNLPAASGMSSSSALITAMFAALAAVNGLEESDRYRREIGDVADLAGYLACIENGQSFGALSGDRGVGTQGGSEDHTAMLGARAGQLVQYAFAPVRFERAVPVPPGHTFVVAVSGVRAEKAGAARERYNRASAMLAAAVEIWRAGTGRSDATVAAALDSDPDAVERLRALLRQSGHPGFTPDQLLDRVEHFIQESREIIPAAGDALERADLAAFGEAVDRSQRLAERLLDNQVPETVTLARSARRLGAAAASAFGAGFGGSVWALVEESGAEDFCRSWAAEYRRSHPRYASQSSFFHSPAGPPATRLT